MNDSRAGDVQVHIADPWASVPVRLMEAGCGLSITARLVLVYILDLGRRPNWVIRVDHVQRALGLTETRWKRTRKELEESGYFTKHRGHARDGDWLWTFHVYDTPQLGESNIGSKRTDAKSADAKQSDIRNLTLHSSSLRSKKKAAEAPRAERAAPPPAAAGAAAAEKKEPRRQPRVVCGCTCWNAEDAALVKELTSVHGEDAVEQTAAHLRAAGVDPLPSTVAKAQQEAERAALQAATEQKAEQQEAVKRKARDAEQAKRDARRDDPEARARIAALIKETARKVSGYRT